jgi:hypothetical protein
MDQQFADQSKNILNLIILSFVLILIFMSFENVVALVVRVGILALLGYTGKLVWTQIQQVKALLISSSTAGTSSSTDATQENSSSTLSKDELDALNSNLGLSYLFLFVIILNFIFIARSLVSSAAPVEENTNNIFV